MRVTTKVCNVSRMLVQLYGSANLKRWLWNRDFTAGRYGSHGSAGDLLYPVLERYARGGSILDLGCGAGNTGEELASAAYGEYVGVDVSDVAICKAGARCALSGRAAINRYVRSDILTYVPT